MLGYDALLMAHAIKCYCKEQTECHYCVFCTQKSERLCMLTMNSDVCPEDWNIYDNGEPDD